MVHQVFQFLVVTPGRLGREPFAESGDRGKRGEDFQPGKFTAKVFGDLLDEEVAERDASKTFLAVGDGLENRAIGELRVAYCRIRIKQRLDSSTHAASQRHFDKDQRFFGEGGVEERVAAAICF